VLLDPEHPALTFEQHTLTYRAVSLWAQQVAGDLTGGGLHSGDRVAYVGLNHPFIAIALLAAARVGAIFVPLNYRLSAVELAAQIHDCAPHTLIFDSVTAPALEALRQQIRCKRLIGPASLPWPPPTLRQATRPALPELTAHPDETAILMYTSGTTGLPKGVMLTHRNLWAAILNGILTLEFTSSDTTLITVPLYHAAGLCTLMLPTLATGGHVVLQRSFDAGQLLEAVEAHQVSVSMFVPAIMWVLSQHQRFAAADLSSLRVIIAGGAPVPATLLETYQTRGIPVSQCYGMTESTSMVSSLAPRDAARKQGSCGRPAPLTEVRITDCDGRQIDTPLHRGELWIRGSSVTSGYWNNSTASADAFSRGWFRTGDGAYTDEEGFLYICDRIKDMIISGGENVYPAEVENVLLAHPCVADIAVFGVKDDIWGERVAAAVVAKPGTSPSLESLRAFAETRLAKYKLPTRLELVTELPRTPSGKLIKARLRRAFSE
jgi:fatty-acyl-CoA synthase